MHCHICLIVAPVVLALAPLQLKITPGRHGLYFANLTLGSGEEQVPVIVDTGSAETWVNPSCKYSWQPSGCRSLQRYTKASSDDYHHEDRYGPFRETFSNTGEVVGSYVNDTVTFGPDELSPIKFSQTFAVADYTTVVDAGMLGLGPPARPLFMSTETERLPYKSVLQNVANKLGLSPVFSLDLRAVDDGMDSALIFGGIDTKRYRCKLERVPVYEQSTQTDAGAFPGYVVPLDAIEQTYDDKKPKKNPKSTIFSNKLPVYFDSSSSYITLPNDVANSIQKHYPGKATWTAGGFLQIEKADPYPGSLDFIFSNKTVHVPWTDLLVAGAEKPQLAIKSVENLQFGTLGTPFLRAAYVVFDQDHNGLWIDESTDECRGSKQLVAATPGQFPVVPGCSCKTGEGPTPTIVNATQYADRPKLIPGGGKHKLRKHSGATMETNVHLVLVVSAVVISCMLL